MIGFDRRVLFVGLMLLTGCVKQKTVQDFGLTGQAPKRAHPALDTSVRALFQNQTKQPFNGVVDDPRIRTLQTRLTATPDDVDVRLELAAIYETYRLHDDALQQYAEAFDRRPSETAVLGIARCNEALNRAWRAIPLLEQFLKESPTAAAWNTLGLLQDSSGDFVAGEVAHRAAVALTPTSDRWHNNLGNNLSLQNKTDEAEREFRLALELNPNFATARNNLATVLARKGDLEGALQEFLVASDEATARNNLAVVLMEFGRFEQSREELIKALAVRRNFAPALSNFKLVQDHIRERADLQKRPAQTKVRVASVEQEQSPYEQTKEQR